MERSTSFKIDPAPMPAQVNVVELVDEYFTAYNSARLRELCHLLSQQVIKPGVTVGLSLSGAMTPAGFGSSLLAPLIRRGYIDWIVSTGANLYHDLHYGLGLDLYTVQPFVDDAALREQGLIRNDRRVELLEKLQLEYQITKDKQQSGLSSLSRSDKPCKTYPCGTPISS